MKSPFSKTTQAKIAACEALGLSYWADHPATGCMWAVDDQQQAFVVRWYRSTGMVALVTVGEPIDELRWDRNGNTRIRKKYPIIGGELVKIPA
ncbi:hypothetical protein SEA_SYDNAT_78 [Mycobacterium phage SydNat]|uniref:Uncharacterized protein n=1 Tax=Mycobacterium phage Zolita TaxID=2593355 RepID=A0A514U2J5_9CAUD|nr:hypothetical protein KIP50_gp14 [Mycobacterium phage Zolita]QDK03170.1 hypothetical protein SEA_ZOLITA_77 [Mycobacterium phage Zolita]UVK64296.1 hypothetical protein SEA_SYDNAT_78 [Mycobacterium phage SydNat]UVK64384.1 hypothetical protein SEA_GHOULBOY_79 [Mycobacterium phage Ghoulboy]